MKNNKVIKIEAHKENGSRSEKFRKLSGLRVQRLLDTFRQIGNLSNKRYYSYTEEEKKIILKKIKEAHNELVRKWNNPVGTNKTQKKKKNFWENVDI